MDALTRLRRAVEQAQRDHAEHHLDLVRLAGEAGLAGEAQVVVRVGDLQHLLEIANR